MPCSLPAAIGSRSLSQAAPGVHLHVVSADGRDVRQVTHGEGEQNILPQWSGDGAWLYFYRLRPSKSFRKISVEGGTSTEVAAWDFQRESDAKVDPQGRAVVYTIVEGRPGEGAPWFETWAPGRNTRWVAQSTALVGHPIPRPSSATTRLPDPSGDIYNRWNVAACPADGRPCRTLARGFRAIPAGDGSRLFYVRDTGAARNMREVWTVSVDGSESPKGRNDGTAPAGVELRRLADGPDRLHPVECEPARALGGAIEVVVRTSALPRVGPHAAPPTRTPVPSGRSAARSSAG